MYSDNNLPTNKICGKSLDDCKIKLFEMYHKNYQIKNIQTIPHPGLFGIFKKDITEVTYVINNKENSYNNSVNAFEKNKDEILNNLGVNSSTTKQIANLDKKIDTLMSSLSSQISGINAGSEKVHKSILKIEELLEENEFSKEYIQEISDKIRSEFSLDELENFEQVEKQVIDWIGESIKIAKIKTFRPPHVIILVGPTGVGKTTTIAKLAAQEIIIAGNNGLKQPVIRLISADTTRVAAEEQLRRYGKIMEIPVDKAENADDIKAIYKQCKDSTDVIIIDTAGYSPNDSEHISKLKNTLSVDGIRADIYLAITASTKVRDLRNIIQNYEPFGFASVIITKCDETSQYGNIISILSEKNIPVSYVTYGQTPGKNISRPNVIGFLKRLVDFNIDRIHIEDKFGE